MALRVRPLWFRGEWPQQILLQEEATECPAAARAISMETAHVLLAAELQALSASGIEWCRWRQHCGRGQPPRWTQRHFKIQAPRHCQTQYLRFWQSTRHKLQVIGRSPMEATAAAAWLAVHTPPIEVPRKHAAKVSSVRSCSLCHACFFLADFLALPSKRSAGCH